MAGPVLGRNQLVGPACWVCAQRFKDSVPPGPAVRNDHHIFPVNAGGADGPLVSLCVTHHNVLHEIAKRIQGKADFKDLLAGEATTHYKKLLWLASCVVKAEAAAEDDPNKHLGVSFKLSVEEVAVLDKLRRHYGNASRKELVMMGLKLLAQKLQQGKS
jgi:hypothetical protein